VSVVRRRGCHHLLDNALLVDSLCRVIARHVDTFHAIARSFAFVGSSAARSALRLARGIFLYSSDHGHCPCCLRSACGSRGCRCGNRGGLASGKALAKQRQQRIIIVEDSVIYA
jgi:hypothetical protein